MQRYVLPPLAVLLVMRQLLNVAASEGSSQLVETVTWVAIIFAGISLVNAFLTPQSKASGWQLKVPNLFFQMFRALVVFTIAYYIVSGVWSVDVTQFITAVGVGSLAIALALQNTLSNLVSGLLLLIAKPFKPGDWIDVGGTQSRVTEQSWWAVTIEDRGWGTKVTIPNGSLAGATITNYGTGGLWKKVAISLSYDDPPNDVIPALESITEDIENVLSPSIAGVASYGESSIDYELWYEVMPEKSWGVYNTLMSRLYYVVQRHGF
ncbi:mechanosensitive ion channel family protein, partial [Okeania sp. SIO2G5]|uniref:mechanosensitive ion channel family protein n=1 Tax=Okeania sp. SIO2G5 TaxID=2607796 RepID=UPI0013BF0637